MKRKDILALWLFVVLILIVGDLFARAGGGGGHGGGHGSSGGHGGSGAVVVHLFGHSIDLSGLWVVAAIIFGSLGTLTAAFVP